MPLQTTEIHSVSSASHPDGLNDPGSAAPVVPSAIVPASGAVEACAPGIDSRISDAPPVIVAACVTVNVPVSDPVDILYAAPIAIVDELVVIWSQNSVKLPPHEEKTVPAGAPCPEDD
jgi:hypothetical protein